jgi:hypothetical protein
VTADDRNAHRAFVATLGSDAVCLTILRSGAPVPHDMMWTDRDHLTATEPVGGSVRDALRDVVGIKIRQHQIHD